MQVFVGSLTELALFHANSNNFSGGVPILNAKYFYELDLSNNKLTGYFPPNAIQPNLTFLDLRFNTYSGSVPSDVFGKLPYAIAIFLNNNKFNGYLPSNLGYSPVQYLSLANNLFTGPIPSSIGHAKNLLEVYHSKLATRIFKILFLAVKKQQKNYNALENLIKINHIYFRCSS